VSNVQPPEMINEILNHLMDRCREVKASGMDIPPTFLLGDFEEKKAHPVIADFHDEQTKDAVTQMIRKAAKAMGSDFVISILESYQVSSELDPNIEAYYKSGGRVSEHPKRQEIILILVETFRTNYTGIIEVKGKEIGELKLKEATEDITHGRFTGFLDRSSLH
jgi:hypothetical protein